MPHTNRAHTRAFALTYFSIYLKSTRVIGKTIHICKVLQSDQIAFKSVHLIVTDTKTLIETSPETKKEME